MYSINITCFPFNIAMLFVLAVYNWKGDVRSGLPLEIGETVQILEEHGGNVIKILKIKIARLNTLDS